MSLRHLAGKSRKNFFDLLLAALVLIFVAVYLGWHLYDRYQETLEHEYALLELNAEHAQARISDNLRSIDFLLQGVAGDRLNLPAEKLIAFEASLVEKVQAIPVVERIGTINLRGRVDAASDPGARGTDLSQSEFFTMPLKRHGPAGVFISRPYRAVDGKTYFTLSHLIRNSRGQAAGVAYARVAPEIFRNTLRTSDAISEGHSLLANTRGDLLYGGSDGVACLGEKLLAGAAHVGHLDSDALKTRHLAQDEANGRRCLSVFYKVPQTPLIVATFRDYDAAILPWQRESVAALARFALVLLFVVHFVRSGRERIRTSQRLSDQLLEKASVMVIGLDFDWRVVLFNKTAELISGYSRAEALGTKWFEKAMPRERYPEMWAKDWAVLRDSAVLKDRETPLLTKDGKERHIIWHRVLMATEGPEPPIVVFGTDVTERRAAEALFRAIAEHSNDALIIFDGQQHIRYASPAVERITGYPLNQFTDGSAWPQVLAPTGGDKPMRSALRHVLERPASSIVFEQAIRHSDGQTLTLEVIMTNLLEAPGIYGVLAIGRDITARKEAERALALNELNLRRAQEIAKVGSLGMNYADRTMECSEECSRIFGFPPGEVAYEAFLSRLHPDDRARVEPQWQGMVAGEFTDSCIYRIVVRGAVKWIVGRTEVEFDAQGRPLRGLGTVQDITERMEAQEALRRATEIAESANRSKGEFLASMSHEIRTPMNAVIGLAQLALTDAADPVIRDYLQKIHASSHSLLGILNDILDYSKIEAGYLKIEREALSLQDLLHNTCQLFQAEARIKGLELTLEIAPDVPPRVMGDWLRLSQVLNNLVSNAIKFTRQGAVRLHLSRDGGMEEYPRLVFEIEDSGIGMTAGQLEQLFQPFVQGDGSISRKYGGTGLGLAISQRLVRLMGGEITVESHPGAGSLFSFALYLPVAASMAETAAGYSGETPDVAAPDHLGALTGLRVLVVEDNRFNQQVMAEFLRKGGMQVALARDGNEALEILEQERVDAVLMDLQMPGMDGYETTRRIRSDPRWARLPVIASTASTMENDRGKSQAAGMNDYLVKPIQAAKLYAALARLLSPATRDVRQDGAEYEANLLALTRSLRALHDMIEENEFVPDEAMRKLQALLPEDVDQELRPLADALSRYDYGRAGKALKALAATLGVRFEE